MLDAHDGKHVRLTQLGEDSIMVGERVGTPERSLRSGANSPDH